MNTINLTVPMDKMIEAFIEEVEYTGLNEAIKDITALGAYIADAIAHRKVSDTAYSFIMYLYLMRETTDEFTIIGEDDKPIFDKNPYRYLDITEFSIEHLQILTVKVLKEIIGTMEDPAEYFDVDALEYQVTIGNSIKEWNDGLF